MSEPSPRKPLGVLLILALVLVWAVVIASAAPLIGTLHWALQAVVYTVAGIAWIFPLKPLLRWMEAG